jgi:hypothetical protein
MGRAATLKTTGCMPTTVCLSYYVDLIAQCNSNCLLTNHACRLLASRLVVFFEGE